MTIIVSDEFHDSNYYQCSICDKYTDDGLSVKGHYICMDCLDSKVGE